jgi:hypothetical protein
MRPDRPKLPLAESRTTRYELDLREARLGLRSREIALVLGTLLVVAGVVLAFYARPETYGLIAPGSLIGAGIVFVRFAGGQEATARGRGHDR